MKPLDSAKAIHETISVRMPRADASSRQVQQNKSASTKLIPATSKACAARILWPALLVCLGFAIYVPSLRFGFILDDHRFTGDSRIQESGHLPDYFSNYVWAQFTGGPPSFYRPVFILWLRLSFMIAELSPLGWHLLSIAKHLLVGIVLWFLLYKLIGDRLAAFAAAALFLLHPSHTESVSWVTVPDPLLTLCLLLSLLFYLRYLDSYSSTTKNLSRKSRKNTERKTTGGSPRWLIASVAAYFTGLLAKETAIIFPVVILGLAVIGETSLLTSRDGSRRDHNARRWEFIPAAVFAVVSFLYLLIRWSVLGGKLAPATQHLRWTTVVLSWPATLWFYVKAMIWPVKSYSFADPILIESFSTRGVLLPVLALLLCGGLLIAGWVWAWRAAQRQLNEREAANLKLGLIAGGLLLVLPLLPTLNLNALNPGDFLHGRYVYLPLAGLSMLVAIGLHLANSLRWALLCATGVLAIVFVPLTWSQEKQWRDDATVFTMAHELAPHNRPVARNLADTRVRAALLIADDGRCSEAMPVFDEVNREYPDDWYTWAGRGICFVRANDLVRAEEAFHRAADLSRDPRVAQQWQALREHMGLPTSTPAR
jgi:hypothetical protein